MDDLKQHNGQTYTGMNIGDSHDWDYTNARWQETKTGPDTWNVTFTSIKKKRTLTTSNAGPTPGTQYHWYIIGNQRVTKLDANTYDTRLEAIKYKLGHKRPYWQKMSYEYPEQTNQKERTIHILKQTLKQLEETP